MKDDYKSASEINKFVYCKLQWYYEKTYGSKKLNELQRIELEKNGIKHDAKAKRYVKGDKFHDSYLGKYRFKKILTHIVMFALILLSIIFIFNFGN